MGFFSPGFVIGAASSLTNQIEDAKERNAEMMERRRDQFDQLSREAKRELSRKKMTEQKYIDLAKEVLSPELKIHIGDDPALLAAAGRSFETQSKVRGLTPSNFNKSLELSGLTEEGKFDPAKAFNIIEPPKMDVETQTEEGFFGRAIRGITGAPSQQELAETDPSRITSDIKEASVNLNRIYNPVAPDSREWTDYEKLFAESEGLKAVIDPYDRTVDRVETFAKAGKVVEQKFNILNELRMGQAYTAEDLPGILNDIKIIYGKIEKLPKDQADAVVAKIASDMNRTSVPEVMQNLDQYVPKANTGQTTGGTASTTEPPAPTEDKETSLQGLAVTNPDLYAVASQQIESGEVQPVREENGVELYQIEYDDKIYTIKQDAFDLSVVSVE